VQRQTERDTTQDSIVPVTQSVDSPRSTSPPPGWQQLVFRYTSLWRVLWKTEERTVLRDAGIGILIGFLLGTFTSPDVGIGVVFTGLSTAALSGSAFAGYRTRRVNGIFGGAHMFGLNVLLAIGAVFGTLLVSDVYSGIGYSLFYSYAAFISCLLLYGIGYGFACEWGDD